MNHIDGDTLALLALDSVQPSDLEQEHLGTCSTCAGDLGALRRNIRLGKESQGVTLEQPPAVVWDRIYADISSPPRHPGTSPNDPAPTGPPKPVDGLPAGGRPMRGPRRRVPIAIGIPVTAAVAVAAAVGGIISAPYLQRTAPETSLILQRATLAALPGWDGAHGTATLHRARDGQLTLTVTMTPGSRQPAIIAGPLREVWLMRPDLTGLMSMGFLTSDSGTFAVPPSIDIAKYDLVDISAQRADGNPAHSGQSIMRGTLH